MQRKQVLIVALAVLLAVAATATLALAQGPTGTGPALAPLKPSETAFTYQGQLKSGGSLVTRACAMVFGLYDRPSDGGSIGSPIATTVPVTNGLFTADLDFGSDAFDGTGRWLDIQVDCTGTPVALPRQWVTPAPMALFASNANLLDGQDSSAFVALSGAQTVGGLKTFSSGLGFPDGTTQLTAATKPRNVIVVAKSGGDYTTISAALTDILDNSALNPYLIYVAPGTYTETVPMKQYVDIEGAGELATKITFTGSDSSSTGTVLGANDAELRFLTVENTGGATTYAKAILNISAAPRLTHVTATASGGTYNSGVNNNICSPAMTNVTASASGGTNSYGVYNSYSSPTMRNVIASASGGTNGYGVYNYYSSPTLASVTASASGATDNYGVHNFRSSPTIDNSIISANGGTNTYGINNVASNLSYTVRVNNSRLSAATNTIRSSAYFTTLVGASQLDGGPVSAGGGTLKCAGVYDANYTFSPSTCP
jgi:hypothetical protein